MVKFILPRFLSALVVVVGVACLVFLLIHLIPGDPIDVMLGETARPADKEALRQTLGLHLPVHEQVIQYFKGLITLNWGTSIFSGRSVSSLILERVPATVELSVAAMLIAIMIAFPLGILAAIRHKTFIDFSAMGFALLGVSIPNFWLGPLLIMVGALWLGWFPVSGREGWAALVLPAITLGTAMAAILSRMIRSSLLEVIHEDFIRTARAKGVSEWKVIVHHG
ncbi:MAG: ABC transporter permease, partial [Nitrospirota bacterium]